ncbi:GIY-YIG nuclease family protein [Roseospirillum parvum]|uniref:Uri superfamily endonuclease n=1 Tax=Roseospirillum parvum TaxID=83401 RepID=A0A1G8DF99_9PROT|nr:DUF123 domain-containing protein [Roseospirillum parvum]SDH56387.1 protein of unknown function DUF123 [Roseospirillum parvum]
MPGGAYVLRLGVGPGVWLAPGVYWYAGSAYGPGGLRARLGRHLRRDKAIRWHVDRLTVEPAVEVGFLAFPGAGECALVAALLAAGATVPVPGFGSSDCRICPSHLVCLDASSAQMARILRAALTPP